MRVLHRFLLKARYSNTALAVIALLVFLLVVLLAEFYNYYRINDNYKKQIRSESQLVIDKLNNVFDEANEIAHNAMIMKDTPCKAEEYTFKKLVATSNIIRSVTLTRNGVIYCSSIYDLNQRSYVNVKRYIEEPLNLFESNHLTPETPIISYSVKEGDWGVFVGIHGKVIADILHTTEFERESFIIINNKLIDTDNTVLEYEGFTRKGWSDFSSNKYPFKILVNSDAIKSGYQTILSFIILTILLLLLGIVTFIYIAMTAAKREFKRAIVENELVPYYQLIVSTADFKWHGLEVLTRWRHPKHGLIRPNKFISLAERSKLIIPMTKGLMDRVATELTPYIFSLPKPFHVSFNIHASHLDDPELIADCQQFLARFPADTIKLVLELTEGQFVKSSDKLDKLIHKFHEIGVSISIDDFGTGYSNLGYLQKYKIDNLKIDRMFVSTIYKKNTANYLLDTIIGLAKNMEMKIVAEGVETIDQLHYLSNQGVEYIQGFLFSRPSPIEYTIKSILKPYNAPLPYQQFSMFSE
ncbi:EAL domain-containing protein [Entomomonas asaccharolytica]|uniref:cyclic-guanylate-specific phosphodiesterase n=1 Tax=Entomomonas asaccharolytica TaxID=2785331 RepID=A0A974NDK2_9GAMM|nr:EAL domain-containing protein [Entomomonas asaccharolytica]QQP84422.1 EAL domain-containing protein [Entomomonas asaccharolytica]